MKSKSSSLAPVAQSHQVLDSKDELLAANYPDSSFFSSLRRKALKWFDRHQRILPWRTLNTPYRVWISEIMLQQTQVQTVVDYFNRFVERFPDVHSLAQATESQVLSLWEGLGYYRRARNLHAAAKYIDQHHHSKFPETFEEVINLPGIGRYTAGAILSISKDQRHPILEGNTYRLFSRLLGLTQDPRAKDSEKLLWQFATDLLPGPRSQQRAGQLNQAMMEIGSEVCKVNSPQCIRCPLRTICKAHELGLENEIPKTTSKKSYRNLHQALLILEDHQSQALVRKRNANEWWSGLWDFVRLEIEPSRVKQQLKKGIAESLSAELGIEVNLPAHPSFTLKHAVTHYRIQLACYHVRCEQLKNHGRYQLKKLNKIGKLPLNVTARQALDRVLKSNV